ncbi:hypothetical protein TNCV_168591 [Trichonephila clavipes]|nr:hypothetical protein TNCV_168591 [Trichonephila clavipes]
MDYALTSHFEAYISAIGDGPRKLEPRSRDENGCSRSGSPLSHTTPIISGAVRISHSKPPPYGSISPESSSRDGESQNLSLITSLRDSRYVPKLLKPNYKASPNSPQIYMHCNSSAGCVKSDNTIMD